MASKNVETLRGAHECWNRRDFDAMVSVMVQNTSYKDHPRGLSLRTKDEFKEWVMAWAKAFPDGKITNAEYIDAGDTVIAQFVAEGTNNGPLGPYPSTGRRMSLPFCEIWQFDAKGQMISGGVYYDQFTLLTQLGHMQKAAAAGTT